MMISTTKPRRLTFTCFESNREARKWLERDNNAERFHSFANHFGKVIINHYERVVS